MTSLTMKTKRGNAFGIKVALSLALATLAGSALVTPAFADENQRQDYRQDRGHGHGYGHSNHRGDRDRQDWRERHDYGHPYYYAQPVYVPPPVYEAPRESPGISLFLPLNFRR